MAACSPGDVEKVSRVDVYQVVRIPLDCGEQALDIHVTMDRAGKVAGLYITPRTKGVAPARLPNEETVTVGGDSLAVEGILTLPPADGRPADDPSAGGPFPTVVLLGGSGPVDRDSTVGANKPFRDLAAGLSARGIAVLRMDKRTVAHPDSIGEGFTLDDEQVLDTLDALALLAADPRIDNRRIFLLGHSLGAVAALRVANRQPSVAGLILCAAPARPLYELMVEQVRYFASLEGSPSPTMASQIAELEKIADSLATLDETSPHTMVLGAPTSYWLDLNRHDPIAQAIDLPHRLLFIQGGRDDQVTMEDLTIWKTRLAQANRHATWSLHPTLNHLLIPGNHPSTPHEYNTPGHLAKEVIDIVSEFVLEGVVE